MIMRGLRLAAAILALGVLAQAGPPEGAPGRGGPLHRNGRPRPHLSRGDPPLRDGAGEPRHPAHGVGRMLRLPRLRPLPLRLLPHPPQRHGLPRLRGRAPAPRHGPGEVAVRPREPRRPGLLRGGPSGPRPGGLRERLPERVGEGRARILRRGSGQVRHTRRAYGDAPHGAPPLHLPGRGVHVLVDLEPRTRFWSPSSGWWGPMPWRA